MKLEPAARAMLPKEQAIALLCRMALADSEATPSEIDEILKIAWRRKVSNDVVMELLLDPANFGNQIPKPLVARIELLYDVARVAAADGYIHPAEKSDLWGMAADFGVRDSLVQRLVSDLLASALNGRPSSDIWVQGKVGEVFYQTSEGDLLYPWASHAGSVDRDSQTGDSKGRDDPGLIGGDGSRPGVVQDLRFRTHAVILEEGVPFHVTKKPGAYDIRLNPDHPAFPLFEPLLDSPIARASSLSSGYRAVLFLLLSWGTYENALTGPRKEGARDARVDWGRELRRLAEDLRAA